MATKTRLIVKVVKVVEGTPEYASDDRPGETVLYAQSVESAYKGLEVSDLINLVNNQKAREALREASK